MSENNKDATLIQELSDNEALASVDPELIKLVLDAFDLDDDSIKAFFNHFNNSREEIKKVAEYLPAIKDLISDKDFDTANQLIDACIDKMGRVMVAMDKI